MDPEPQRFAMYRFAACLSAILAATVSYADDPEFPMWRTTDGHETQAKFHGVSDNGMAILLVPRLIPIDRLDKQSRDQLARFARDARKAKETPDPDADPNTDYVTQRTPDPKPEKQAPADPPKMNAANYAKIQPGMTLERVVGIVGRPDQELSRSQIGGITTVMYTWQAGVGGANANMMFQDGRLVQKSQFGLR